MLSDFVLWYVLAGCAVCTLYACVLVWTNGNWDRAAVQFCIVLVGWPVVLGMLVRDGARYAWYRFETRGRW